MNTNKNAPTPDIRQIVDRILAAETITNQEHSQLMSYCLNDRLITQEERLYLNQILDAIQLGNLHFSA